MSTFTVSTTRISADSLFLHLNITCRCYHCSGWISPFSTLRMRYLKTSPTPWHKNAFCFTGTLWGVSTDHWWIPLTMVSSTGQRWIPLTRGSYSEIWCGILSSAWTGCWTNSWAASDLRHCDCNGPITKYYNKTFLCDNCFDDTFDDTSSPW